MRVSRLTCTWTPGTLTQSRASLLLLIASTESPVGGSQSQGHVTEDNKRRGQPRPVLVGHDVPITVVPPDFIGRGCHVKINVAVNEKYIVSQIQSLGYKSCTVWLYINKLT